MLSLERNFESKIVRELFWNLEMNERGSKFGLLLWFSKIIHWIILPPVRTI